MLNLYSLEAVQTTVTNVEFAEFLAGYEIWGLHKRNVHTGELTTQYHLALSGVLVKGKMTKIHKELMSLDISDDKHEYIIAMIAVTEEDDPRAVTFIRDGDKNITFEVQ